MEDKTQQIEKFWEERETKYYLRGEEREWNKK